MSEEEGRWITSNEEPVFIEKGETLKEAFEDRQNANEYGEQNAAKEINIDKVIDPTLDLGATVKGFIFKTNKPLAVDRLGDFDREGISKLGENTYIIYWHSFQTHDTTIKNLQKQVEIKNEQAFTVSMLDNTRLNVEELFRLGKYDTYKDELVEKFKDHFGTSLTTHGGM